MDLSLWCVIKFLYPSLRLPYLFPTSLRALAPIVVYPHQHTVLILICLVVCWFGISSRAEIPVRSGEETTLVSMADTVLTLRIYK